MSTRVEELQSKVRAAEEKAVAAEAKLDEYKEEVGMLIGKAGWEVCETDVSE